MKPPPLIPYTLPYYYNNFFDSGTMDAVKQLLVKLGLARYSEACEAAGYDSLHDFIKLSAGEVTALVSDTGMKKRHGDKLREYLESRRARAGLSAAEWGAVLEINAEISEVDARRFVLRLGGMSLSSKATLVGKLAAGSEDEREALVGFELASMPSLTQLFRDMQEAADAIQLARTVGSGAEAMARADGAAGRSAGVGVLGVFLKA